MRIHSQCLFSFYWHPFPSILPILSLSWYKASVTGKLSLRTRRLQSGIIMWLAGTAVPVVTFSANIFVWISTGAAPSCSRGTTTQGIGYLTPQLPCLLRMLIILLSLATLPISWQHDTSRSALKQYLTRIHDKDNALQSRHIWSTFDIPAFVRHIRLSEWVGLWCRLRWRESLFLEAD